MTNNGLPARRSIFTCEQRPEEDGGVYVWFWYTPRGERRRRRKGRALRKLFARLKGKNGRALTIPRDVNEKNVIRAIALATQDLEAEADASLAAVPAEATPLVELVESYNDALEARGRTTRYAEEMRRRLLATLGRETQRTRPEPLPWRTINDLVRRPMSEYLRERKAATSIGEANADLRAWRAFGYWLVEEEYLRANPFARLREGKTKKARGILTSDEIDAVLEAARRPASTVTAKRRKDGKEINAHRPPAPAWLYPALLLGSNTGARPFEVATMRWEHVDMRKHEVTVRRKRGEDWIVWLSPRVMKWLRSVDEKDRHGLLVKGLPYKEGKTWSGGFARTVKTCFRDAGVGHASFYWLRHSVCTEMIRAGVELPKVQQAMGHKVIQTTMKYYHPGREAAGAVKALPWTKAKRGRTA